MDVFINSAFVPTVPASCPDCATQTRCDGLMRHITEARQLCMKLEASLLDCTTECCAKSSDMGPGTVTDGACTAARVGRAVTHRGKVEGAPFKGRGVNGSCLPAAAKAEAREEG